MIFDKNSERIIKNERKRQKPVTSGFFDKSDNREKQGGRSDLNREPRAGETTTSPFSKRLFRAGLTHLTLRPEPFTSPGLRPPAECKSSRRSLTQERVSEVDLMSAIYPLSVHRRIEQQWAERIKSLRQIHGHVFVATERTLQHVFNNDGSLIPVRVRAVVDRRRAGQSRD